MLAANFLFLDHEELPALGFGRQAEHIRRDVRVLGDHMAVQLAVDPKGVFNGCLLLGCAAPSARAFQRRDGVFVGGGRAAARGDRTFPHKDIFGGGGVARLPAGPRPRRRARATLDERAAPGARARLRRAHRQHAQPGLPVALERPSESMRQRRRAGWPLLLSDRRAGKWPLHYLGLSSLGFFNFFIECIGKQFCDIT